MFPLNGSIMFFGLSDLFLELRNAFLKPLLLAMLKAPKLVVETHSHITPLNKGHLLVPQLLERCTRCVKLPSECTGKRAGDVVQKT